MLPAESIRMKPKSPGIDANINLKTSITCTNVPESLFDAATVKKHFSKFGRVQKIRLFPKRLMCIIEYDQPMAVERAILNAGAFDGFMFDVTRTKHRIRRKSKKDDDTDWVPDSDVEEELKAMGSVPVYKHLRDKSTDVDSATSITKTKITNQGLLRKSKLTPKRVQENPINVNKRTSGTESPVLVKTAQTSLSTFEAAAELHQLRSRVSRTPDEQWRTLDARDRILRGWGGAGSRVKVGGATIGTCPDMCPEKELLHRQAEHQVMTLETIPGSDGLLESWRAVKQYSRSSADQEMPMCYELRPASVLMRTCSYLLHDVADTTRQVTLADWFHFMWDRLRGIRKDITQQALCCADSISLVEMCARFHAHCAARLADLEHTQFDQKLNTDNLTKCLQTLKHMYTDVDSEKKPNEAEFRGYIALLNLGDSNFWWEIKQLPQEIQKSKDITFAIKIFNALDNNNYVRFFRLIKESATYLQACILLRYFNDVRARGLARMIKAYAPRGGSRFPADDLINALAFESVDNMKSFISHYGLRLSRTDNVEIGIILDRHQFIEDSDPYPITRAIELVESKRKSTVCKVIAGGEITKIHCENYIIHSSFDEDGKIKEPSIIAEDQRYNTINDTDKDINSLKMEMRRLAQDKNYSTVNKFDIKSDLFIKPEVKTFSLKSAQILNTSKNLTKASPKPKLFSFTPAIPVASAQTLKQSPEKLLESNIKNAFSFSKPQESSALEIFSKKEVQSVFTAPINKNPFETMPLPNQKNVFNRLGNSKETAGNSQNIFSGTRSNEKDSVFFVKESPANVFGKVPSENIDKAGANAKSNSIFGHQNVFGASKDNIFAKTDNTSKFDTKSNIFAKPLPVDNIPVSIEPSSIFGSFAKSDNSPFMKPKTSNSIEQPSKDITTTIKITPGSLFKNVLLPPNGSDSQSYSIFKSKNKAQTVADNLLNSVSNFNNPVTYNFNQDDDELKKQNELEAQNEVALKERQIILQQKLKEEEIKRLRVEEKLREESQKQELKRREETKRLEENRKREEAKKQEYLKQKQEDDRKAELQRKAKKFQDAVEKESKNTVEELIGEITNSCVCKILKEELDYLENLLEHANTATKEIIMELTNEVCRCEMIAEIFWTKKVMKKWFLMWRRNYTRNCARRKLLEDTPVWLTENTPIEAAIDLRRPIENAALKNMNDIHKGYIFTGELKTIPLPVPYNILDLIRSSLLKRMKQINYPNDKCIFWKATIVLPQQVEWLYKKIHLEQWVKSAFSDNQKHESDNLIHVTKQSWNQLLDFAISICLTNMDKINYCADAMDGTNGLLFYITENEFDFICKFEKVLKYKYQYQVLPIAIVIAKCVNVALHNSIEELLSRYVKNRVISVFKIFIVDPQNICETLNKCTKSALKWMAKHYPQTPPLEIDSLKSICQRYLGNEIWCKLKTDCDSRINKVVKDLNKLIACYNVAVDKLTEIITNEDHFNYMSFPLEFKKYLNEASPYPKPYEFITSNVKTLENTLIIKTIMKQLKLPQPTSRCFVKNIQQQIRSYCYQIGWFNNPDKVICKVITALPNALMEVDSPEQDFSDYFQGFSLIDVLNFIVYEKITMSDKLDKTFGIYEKSMLQNYSNAHWLYEIDALSQLKHKAIEYEDEIDYFIEAKRRKVAMDSLDTLILDDSDQLLVDKSILSVGANISQYKHCNESLIQLEQQLNEGKKKSVELENLLKSALSDVNM